MALKELIPRREKKTLTYCQNCGVCTGSCVVARVEGSFNPRRLLREVLLGVELSVDPWLCAVCYDCQERCPRGVRLTDLLAAIRRSKAAEGKLPDAVKVVIKTIKEHGYAFEIGAIENKRRQRLGLPELKPVEEIKLLLR